MGDRFDKIGCKKFMAHPFFSAVPALTIKSLHAQGPQRDFSFDRDRFAGQTTLRFPLSKQCNASVPDAHCDRPFPRSCGHLRAASAGSAIAKMQDRSTHHPVAAATAKGCALQHKKEWKALQVRARSDTDRVTRRCDHKHRLSSQVRERSVAHAGFLPTRSFSTTGRAHRGESHCRSRI